ncbi:unnamed protein product [Phytomonas sp. Hart1]|nr:unnamed protein product [Phytomonas sp. Hart1]|eukprot:CCW66986.1 unnamed protein product [Phytomonas sp. isolate Hart1]
MIYRLLSKVISFKSSVPDNSKGSDEDHSEWDMYDKELEEVGDFLTTTHLGRLLAARDPSLMELSEVMKESILKNRIKNTDKSTDRTFYNDCEAIIYEQYSKLRPYCSTQSPGETSENSSLSSLPKLHSVSCKMSSYKKSFNLLPSFLVKVLLRRWQFSLGGGTGAETPLDNAKELTNSSLLKPPSNSFESKFLNYIEVVIPCWNTVLASSPVHYGPIFLDHGVERCVVDTLPLLSNLLLSSERAHKDEDIDCVGGEKIEYRKPSKGHILHLTELLLDVLLRLYLRHPPESTSLSHKVSGNGAAANADYRATQLSNQELAQGSPDLFLRSKIIRAAMGSDSSFSSYNVNPQNSVVSHAMVRELVALLTHISKVSVISPLFSSNIAPNASVICVISSKIFLILSVLPFLHISNSTAIDLDEAKQAVNMSVTTLNIFMAQFIDAYSRSFTICPGNSGMIPIKLADSTIFIFNQLTCGMLLITHWLRQSPVIVLQSLNNSSFVENLCSIMRFIGMNFTNASYSKHEKGNKSDTWYCDQNHTSSAQLEAFVSFDYLNNEDLLELKNCKRALARPELEYYPVAAEDAVDEFLYSYLGLLTAQRSVSRSLLVLQDNAYFNIFNQVRLTVLKAFTDYDSRSQSNSSERDMHEMNIHDADLASIGNTNSGNANIQELFGPSSPPMEVVDNELANKEGSVFKKFPKSKLCDNSCLYDLLIQQALGSLPINSYFANSHCSSQESPSQGQDASVNQHFSSTCSPDVVAQLEDFQQLVAAGLYQVLFSETHFCRAYRDIPRLSYVTLYILQQAFTFATGELTPIHNESKGRVHDSEPTMPALSRNVGFDREVMAALTIFASNHNASFTLKESKQRTVYLCSLCAVLVCALRGPKGNVVRGTLMSHEGFALMTSVAVELCQGRHLKTPTKFYNGIIDVALGENDGEVHPVKTNRTCIYSSGALVWRWTTHLLLELTHDESAVIAVLSRYLGQVFSLLLCKDLLEVGEEIIIRLLCHWPSTTSLDNAIGDSNIKSIQCLRPLVSIIWDVIGYSEDFESAFCIKGKHGSHFVASAKGEEPSFDISTTNFIHTMQGSSISTSCVFEDITVLILRCLRGALYRLRHRLSGSSLHPVRMLQHILCNQNTSGDCFLKLIHCVSRPWSNPIMHAEGVKSVLQTLTSLIAFSPALRNHLFSVITPDELVKCFSTEWFAMQPNDWKGFIEAFVVFIYEDIDKVDQRAEEIPSASREAGIPPSVSSMPANPNHLRAVCTEQKHFNYSIQNAVVLIPLFEWLKQLVLTIPSDSPEADASKIEALGILLKTLHSSFLHCRVSRFLCAQAGLFEALAQLLLPLINTMDCTTMFHMKSIIVSILNSITVLMKISAIEHIDIKHVKRLLLMIVHSSNVRQREKMVPLVTNILSEVTKTFLCKQVTEPQNYIAFRRNNGIAGVRAMIQEYSADGYSIFLCVRVENDIQNLNRTEEQTSQTIFSLQNSDFKTQLKLNVLLTTGCLSIIYLDSQKHNMEVDVGFSIPLASWVHLAIVHRPYSSLTRSNRTKNVTIFKNGEEKSARLSVHYPNVIRGWFLIGTDNEAVDRLSSDQGFVGQVANVHFFTRPLQRKEISQLCSRTLCRYCRETAAMFNTGSDVDTAACIQSSSLQRRSPIVRQPSLPSIQSSEQGRTVTDVLSAPAVISGETWPRIENDLTVQAAICIDPRLSGKGKLYNLSSLLRDRLAESELMVFEGTLICCSTSIIDALHVLGALYTVVMPILMLLVNSQLPFSERTLLLTFSELDECIHHVEDAPLPTNEDKERNEALRDMLQLLHILAHDDVVHVGMTESFFFLFIANVLHKLGPIMDVTIPEQIHSFCVEKLFSSDVLFEAAYTAFFLSSNILHAYPYTTQLVSINCQRISASMNIEVRSRIRALGAQMFIVSEIQFTILHYMAATVYPSAHGEEDTSNEQSTSFTTKVFSPHGKSLHEELFRFFEVLTVDPITLTDAVSILHFTSILYRHHRQLPGDELTHALRRIRIILFTRNPLLCQFLGREDYLSVLLPFLNCLTVPADAQRQVLLLIILLVSRSKHTQKYMNPTLFITKDAVHTPHDISLAWLKEYLCLRPTDIALYLTLRSALFGDFVISDPFPLVYTPLSVTGQIEIPSVLELILLLIQTSHDSFLRQCVLNDLVDCLKNEPKAWQRLISIQGWHLLITDIYKSERKRSAVDVKPLNADLEINKCDSLSLLPLSISAPSSSSTPSDGFLLICSFIMSFTLSQALINTNYAVSEQELLVMYLQDQGLHVLLNHVLCGVADCLKSRLLTSTETNSNMFILPNTNVIYKNLAAFVYTVENVLFHSASCGFSSGNDTMFLSAPHPSSLKSTGKHRYIEWNELVVVVNQDAVSFVEYTDLTFSVSNPLTLRPPVYLEDAVKYVGETHFASHEGRRDLLSSPDGRWFHMSLALKVAYLLTTNESILNTSCAHLAMGVEPAHTYDTRCRRGGFLRIFERLMRVASSMMLNSVGSIEALLKLLDRYTNLVTVAPSGLLSLIRSKAIDSQKNHSPLTISMSMMYFIQNLVLRRLHVAGIDNIIRYSDTNADLIKYFKRLFGIFKIFFEKMIVFASQSDKSLNLRASEETGFRCNTPRTFNWLCDGSSCTPSSLIDEFLKVSSRVDYSVFLKRCMLAMERNNYEAKAVADGVPMERQHAISRLREMISGFDETRKVVLDSIECLFKAGASKASDTRFTLVGSQGASEALRTAASTPLSAVVARFMEHIKNTIWNQELEGQSGGIQFVRLSLEEQQPLMRSKIVLDRGGTNHRAVSGLSGNIIQSSSSGLAPDGDKKRLTRTRFCLSDSEESQWEQGVTEDDKGRLGTEGEINFEIEKDNFWPNKIFSPTYSQITSEATAFGNGVPDDVFSNATNLNLPPIVLSIPCEMSYMMHCWSAMFVIRGMSIDVIIDKENKSYNQQISPGAQPFLIRPQNFGFGIAMIAQVAPGRRFRMKRTAMEFWLHNRRSCLLNFSETATMRLALREIIRKVVAIHRLRDPRRVVSIRSFYVLQENPLKEPLLKWSQDRWLSREMSNFDYLMCLNLLAGRSVNDMAQYPVFPWILADYTSETLDLGNPETFRDLSKPIGACGDDKRRERVKELYEETKAMGDVPSHYFTHYSSAAVVLYYLMRLEPFTTLYILLQGGQFDHPDRMFHIMSTAFNGIINNMQDTRELIPELFYMPELCVNSNDVFFGRKQNNELVDNLVLPPWANSSPHNFIYHMREALECDYVSSMLHHWIDLIFGIQQRGKDAIKALNVFRWHSYEDLESSHSSEVDRHQLLDILDNIGQTPIQLFRQSHPSRRPRELLDPLISQVSLKIVSLHWKSPKGIALISFNISGNAIVVNKNGAAITLKLAILPLKHPVKSRKYQRLSSGCHSTLSSTASSVSTKDFLHLASGVSNDRVDPFQSSTPDSLSRSEVVNELGVSEHSSSLLSPQRNDREEKSSFDISEYLEFRTTTAPLSVIYDNIGTGDGPCSPENAVLLCFDGESFIALGGLFDHSVTIRHLSQAVEDVHLRVHRGRVIRLAASYDSHYLVTGSEDTTFVVWTCHLPRGQRQLEVKPFFTIYRHEDLPTAVHLCSTLGVVATASMDGVLMLHSLNTTSLERTLRHPRQHPIHSILIQSTCYVPNILFYSKMDHIVHQINLNGTMLHSFSTPGRLMCWVTTSEQYLLMHCVPFNRVVDTTAHHSNFSEEGSVLCTPAILFVHSFFMKTLRTVSLPMDTTLSTMACNRRNPQVMLLGDIKGNLTLLRTCAPKSAVLI